MDSTIRLRQLNQAELSGFVSGVFSLFPKVNISGSIIPSGSGIYDLGSATYPYAKAFFNQLNINSGSGINFGNTSFRAYTSGSVAYINIGGITISSSGENIYIQGPSGVAGPSGHIGATGSTGIGITGIIYDTNTHILTFGLSNGSGNSFNFQGLSGATGASLTGFFQSGDLIFPQFDNFRGSGAPIKLIAGPVGPPGSINLFFYSGNGCNSTDIVDFPSGVIINPYYDTSYGAPISLMRGMSYTLDSSGLNTHLITSQDTGLMGLVFSGQTIPYQVGDQSNYYENSGSTGYWRLFFFDPLTPTGVLISTAGLDETFNTGVYGNSLTTNLYRTKISFVANFTAQDHYRYGFATYTIGEDTTNDIILNPSGYAYVVGDVYFSSGIGPVGPFGPSGQPGPQGIQGNIGPSGQAGDNGVSVVSYNYLQSGTNSYFVQFIFGDGSLGNWIPLPSGGPSGVAGPQGLVGSLTNYFSGEFSPTTNYKQNDTISSSGSSYIYTNVSSGAGFYPTDTTHWQILAKKGDVGATGATGYADKYYSNFPIVSGFPTGAGSYPNGFTGITVNGSSLSGSASKFTTGQIVSFRNPSLIGYAYSPYQQILVSTNTNTGSYFYANINSYDSINGIISFTVATGLSNLTGIQNVTIDASHNVLWSGYGNATINLGANTVSGATGPQGFQGIQGPGGLPSVMRNATKTMSYNLELGADSYTIQPSGTDVFNILITGVYQPGAYSAKLDIDCTYFSPGQSIIIKVRNSGVLNGNGESPLFIISGVNKGDIKWPNGIYTKPDNGQVYIYTLLRFPDEFGSFSCYGTYSNPYF
jgi:hypothetical protein